MNQSNKSKQIIYCGYSSDDSLSDDDDANGYSSTDVSSEEEEEEEEEASLKILGKKRSLGKGKEPMSKRRKTDSSHRITKEEFLNNLNPLFEQQPQHESQTIEELRQQQEMILSLLNDIRQELSKAQVSPPNLPQWKIVSSTPDAKAIQKAELTETFIQERKRRVESLKNGESSSSSNSRRRLLVLLATMKRFLSDEARCREICRRHSSIKSSALAGILNDTTTSPPGKTSLDLRFFLHLKQENIAKILAIPGGGNAVSRSFKTFINNNNNNANDERESAEINYSWPFRKLRTLFNQQEAYERSCEPEVRDRMVTQSYEDQLLFHVVSPISVTLNVPNSYSEKYKQFHFGYLDHVIEGICPEIVSLWIIDH